MPSPLTFHDQSGCAKAAAIVNAGGVIAFRTDTFYGLGVDPLKGAAVQRIRALKGRETAKPILILIASLADLDRFIINRSELFDRVAERFWPGPLTIVGAAAGELPEELTAGSGRIGARLPDVARVRELVRDCGGALTATSANLSGAAEARTAAEVAGYFPSGIDLILDGGPVEATKASTVVDLSGDELRVIREGAICTQDIVKSISKV